MFPGNYKPVILVPPPLEKPIEATFHFVGGPFDGHTNTGVIHRELSTSMVVTMKRGRRKYSYRYSGNNTFQYEAKK